MNSEVELQKAKVAYQNGDRTTARSILAAVVKEEPSNSQAWYMLSFMVDKVEQVIHCLNQAIKFDPMNSQISERLRQFQAQNKSITPVQQVQSTQQVRQVQPAQPARQVQPAQQVAKQNTGLFVTNQKEWYREPLFKFFTFLFFTPAWVLIMVTDPEESTTNKIGAVVIQVFMCMIGSWLLLFN
jgi:thioredoxin-like negative regulator of GroEL